MKVFKKTTATFLASTLILSSVSNSVFAGGNGVGSYNPLEDASVEAYVKKEIRVEQLKKSAGKESHAVVQNFKLPGKDRRTVKVFLMGAVFGAENSESNCLIQQYLDVFKKTKKEVGRVTKTSKKFDKKVVESALKAATNVAKNFLERYGSKKLVSLIPNSKDVVVDEEKLSEVISAIATFDELSKFYDVAEIVGVFMVIGGAAAFVGTCVSKGGLTAGIVAVTKAVPTVVAWVTSGTLTATGAGAGVGAGAVAATTGTAAVAAAATAEGGAAAAAAAGSALVAGGTLAASPILVPALALGSVVLVAGGAIVGGGAYVASSFKRSKELNSEKWENICGIMRDLLGIFQNNYGNGILKDNCLVVAMDERSQSGWNIFTRGRENQGYFVGTYMLTGLENAPTGEEYIKSHDVNYKELCENYSKYITDNTGIK